MEILCSKTWQESREPKGEFVRFSSVKQWSESRIWLTLFLCGLRHAKRWPAQARPRGGVGLGRALSRSAQDARASPYHLQASVGVAGLADVELIYVLVAQRVDPNIAAHVARRSHETRMLDSPARGGSHVDIVVNVTGARTARTRA
jgi:hypothetical protein